jgi:hypothetical protein
MCCRIWIGIFEFPHLIICKDVILIDPHVVRVWVSFPFDQILQTPPFAEMPGVQNLLHGIFFFPINQFRGRSGEIWTMHYCFPVRCEKIYVKHGVDVPLRGKFQSIVDSRHHLNDLERAMSSGRKLGGRLIDPEILAF